MSPNNLPTLAALSLLKNNISTQRVTEFLKSKKTILNELSTLRELNYLLEQEAAHLNIVLTPRDWDDAQWALDKNLNLNICILCITDEKYPKYLGLIKDAPPLLFIRGDIEIFSELPGVAIVGAREASIAGKEIARRIAKSMGENNWPVVSGLALGIDTAAHQGALEGKAKTIAVLAGGLDKPSPTSNSTLGFDILESGGAWVSEHSAGTPPKKHHFVPRNRIQVGLSAGSIIVEAKLKSGSLTQAKFCIAQGRPLFAIIPHEPHNPLGLISEGTIHMVNDLGATPIKTRNDYKLILEALHKQKNTIANTKEAALLI